MHPKALLDACSELVRLTLKFDHPADAIVSRFFRDNRGLGPRERATLALSTYGKRAASCLQACEATLVRRLEQLVGDGVTFHQGRLYVVGELAGSTGRSGPWVYAAAPVPEPQTWALLLGVGDLNPRRQRQDIKERKGQRAREIGRRQRARQRRGLAGPQRREIVAPLRLGPGAQWRQMRGRERKSWRLAADAAARAAISAERAQQNFDELRKAARDEQ